MPELLCLQGRSMGPAMRSCSQFDLVLMDCGQSPYNHSEPDSHCSSSREHFLSNTHMHMFSKTKAVRALCRSTAITVWLVQLHLKWQWPRTMGRIKITLTVQSNAPQLPQTLNSPPPPPLFPLIPSLFICQTTDKNTSSPSSRLT